MRTDNNEHKALFTIPTAAYSSALANIKPLPEQRRITGHKQTDAYLWVLEVIRLNEPAHLDAAEAALVKIKISQKRLRNAIRVICWRMVTNLSRLRSASSAWITLRRLSGTPGRTSKSGISQGYVW